MNMSMMNQYLLLNGLLSFSSGSWQGLKNNNFDQFLSLIRLEQEFRPRSLMETDPRYKQIIPYLIFTYDGKYFLMQRKKDVREQRLKNKYSLGIGGHIRREDFVSNDVLDWARREFSEEVNYEGTFNTKLVGILNDDSNPVGEVHVGFILLLNGDSSSISIKSELKSGELLTLQECESFYPYMEEWSQIVYKYLINQ